MDFTVVVDGGGSGCRLGVFDANGKLVALVTDGPAGLSQGAEQAWAHISNGLRALAIELGESPDWLPPALCLGLAGSLQQQRREQFLQLVPAAVNCTLVSDGHAQLLGAGGGEPSACLAVGTGSVLNWLDNSGRFSMAGGWGFPVGDEGSGAWLGMQLVSAYLWFRDARRDTHMTPPVFKLLEQHIGNEVSDVQLWSTSTNPATLAGLAPVIVSAMQQDDEVAVGLLDAGAEQCMKLISLAPADVPLYLAGGLADIYRSRLSKKYRSRIREPQGDALSGLYLITRFPDLISDS